MTSHHFLTGPGRCIAIVFGLLLLGTTDPAVAASGVASCSKHAAALQVLGSGGPEAGRRSGPGYLLWLGGKARLLIDAGPGTRLRFAESGARLEDLDAIFLTHLHVDHANDLPALVKASYFTGRSRELPVGGPSGNAAMPGTLRWLSALFGSDGYRYLEDHLEPGEGDAFRLAGLESDADAAFPAVLWRSQGIAVTAAGVGHGAIPALAYRIEGAGFSIAISGDTHGDGTSRQTLEALAKGVDLFVAHHAIPEQAAGAARALHMPPSRIGSIAAAAGSRRVVLTHRMSRTLGQERGSIEAIRRHYPGPLHFSEDLDCFPLPMKSKVSQGS